MFPKAKRIAENLLFTADIFILFLLLFESRISIPAWLQSVGRMHPMILHFPIVILLLAMGLELFRFNAQLSANSFYQQFTNGLLLAGALFAALTVIMGLLLSKEPGYEGSTVDWHKWTGIAIVFVASAVYRFRDARWYWPAVSKTAVLLCTACIILAGHFGAGITHGDDFISQPLLAQRVVKKLAADKAIIYADLVQPVLAAKCMGCHNPGKSKGGLMLDNPADIIKGGKTGKVFVAGHAGESLLMERINLPETEKKHMPLSGKPQLTSDEVSLIYHWIQSGADFKKKWADLPENDSLKTIAAKFMESPADENFDFPAADQSKVVLLSNNFRVVSPLAKESPALAVNFFNKNVFSPKALEELAPLKKQVVELNLNKMPVTDADMKTIAQFENLRVLNLSFTSISGKELKQLASLKYLRSISLSGNKIPAQAIEPLTQLKMLKKIFVWNTGLKDADLAALQKSNAAIQFIAGYRNDGPPMQLNAPILATANTVFTDTVHLLLTHPIPGARIRYTLDGTTPDSANSLPYENSIVLSKTTVFKARAFKETWLGSDSIMARFYKSMYTPDTIIFVTVPPNAYKGESTKSLADHLTGNEGFTSGRWVGFQKDMDVILHFKDPVKLHSTDLHMLTVVGADIYPPVEVQIWGGRTADHLKLLQTVRPAAAKKGDPSGTKLVECRFDATTVNFVRIKASNVKKVAKWGNSPGKAGWVFTDEILLN